MGFKKQQVQVERKDSDELNYKAHAEDGCIFLSGAATATAGTGYFYGISFGAVKPDSIVIDFGDYEASYSLNGATATSEDLIDFFSPGEYVPLKFKEVTITGSGAIKIWRSTR